MWATFDPKPVHRLAQYSATFLENIQLIKIHINSTWEQLHIKGDCGKTRQNAIANQGHVNGKSIQVRAQLGNWILFADQLADRSS